jgi:rare lipoprotein A
MTTARLRFAVCGVVLFFAYGCATTRPVPSQQPEVSRGVASWYGEEFAGRTTANGEIFDPLLLTAAHRTFPFGTVLDVANGKTGQTVRVRVNDRGPYIGNRVIDLSYAAAEQIGLIEPGIGEVEIRVVKLGNGEREPPVPFEVAVGEPPAIQPGPAAALPSVLPAPATRSQEPAVVDRVEVETERAGVPTRRQVAADGKTFEEVPVNTASQATPSRPSVSSSSPARPTPAPAPRVPASAQFFVQVGAFSVEKNAVALQQRLVDMGHKAFVDASGLFRVRIGPFGTRSQAVAARTAVEANGLSAMIVAE